MGADNTRDLFDIYTAFKVTRHWLGCTWRPPPSERGITSSVDDYMLDFRLPRARYIGAGEHSTSDRSELDARYKEVHDFMRGLKCLESEDLRLPPQEQSPLMQAMASYCRIREGHVY